MFEWSPKYTVGVPSVDAQHQTLFAIAHELYDAMSSGQGRSVLSRLLDRLVQYTVVHFTHEERLMREANYPRLAEHKLQHSKLTAQVKQFQADYQAGKVTMTIQLFQFLKEWLSHHIQESDKAYGPHLSANSVR